MRQRKRGEATASFSFTKAEVDCITDALGVAAEKSQELRGHPIVSEYVSLTVAVVGVQILQKQIIEDLKKAQYVAEAIPEGER